MSDDLREALENAEGWGEESEGQEDTAGAEGPESVEEEAEVQQTEQEVSNEYPTENFEANEDVNQQKEQADSAPETPQDKDGNSHKPPASWTPSAREGWDKIPDTAKAQIAKREAEMTKFMQNTAEARKAIGQLKTTLEPYQNSMMAAGVKDPFQVIGALMNNDHILRHGGQQDKAELVASMIDKFGVDINTLDNILSGQPQQQQSNALPAHIEDAINQRMAPLNNIIQQQQFAQQQQHYQVQQDAANQVQQFGKDKEFLNDVRNDMADLMDLAAHQGRQMTLDEAYNKAVAMNDEIQRVIQERQTLQNSQSLQQKQNAASSVVGTPAGLGNASMINTGNDMRDSIANAWNEIMDG